MLRFLFAAAGATRNNKIFQSNGLCTNAVKLSLTSFLECCRKQLGIEESDVSVTIVDEHEMRALNNRRWTK
eukprot:m.220582 g.220582  ORF g.220582 m.220582 type:complete len:71 (+) comp13833_c0_seq1:99-311(+)